jgi:hypothetical protein
MPKLKMKAKHLKGKNIFTNLLNLSKFDDEANQNINVSLFLV